MFQFIQIRVLAFGGNIPWSTAFKTKVVIKAPLSFFWDEFLNVDCIYIHGVGVLFLSGVFLGVVGVSVV